MICFHLLHALIIHLIFFNYHNAKKWHPFDIAYTLDFMLEEELIDLFTLCLRDLDSTDTLSQRNRITDIGREIHADGGLDAMVNFFFAVRNRVIGETGLDPTTLQSLWDSVDPKWSSVAKQMPDSSNV